MDRHGRLAAALWVVFALVVWNVVFDRVIVLAGRRYVQAAATAAAAPHAPYVRAADWMAPAVTRASRLAHLASGTVLFVGLGGVALASTRPRRRR